MNLLSIILALAIVVGQLIKLPIFAQGGVTILDMVVIFLCCIGLLKIRFKLKKPPLFISAALFFMMITSFSLILTPLRLTPIEYFASLSYTIRFSFFVLLGWLIYSDAFPIFKKNILSILIVSGSGLAIIGILQFVFLPDLSFLTSSGWDSHYLRTVSTFLDPNFAGAFFVLTLILSFAHLGGVYNRHLEIFMILVYLALLTTFSRSSYLMFLISGVVLSFIGKSKILAIAIVVCFIFLLLGFQVYTQLITEPRHIDREKSASLRLNTWQQGWQLFSSHPILGIGFNAYRYALKQYNLADEQFILSHGGSSNDSSLLFVAATTGVIGLISYLFFLFCLIFTNLNNRKYLLAAGLGLLLHSFFANSLFYPPILAWIILTAVTPKK